MAAWADSGSSGRRNSRGEGVVTFEEVGKAVDHEFEKFVQFVEHEVRPTTRKELSELLRKASAQLAKMAESLSK
jgi:hypothetical protein